jgi:GTP-binding protein EngB required for normal cell division
LKATEERRKQTRRMGMEVPAAVVTGAEEAGDASNTTLGRRPSILLIGSKNVGKRTILNSAFLSHA